MLRKLLNKYNSISPAVKMAFWFLVCSFLQKGIGFLTTPIFTRVMLEEEYGRFSIFNSWSSIVSTFVSLNIAGNCYTRGLVVNEKDKDRFGSTLQGLLTTCVLISAILFFLFRSFVFSITGLTPVLMALMLIEILLTNAFNFYYNRKRVEYDYKPIVAITIAFTILRPVLSVVAVQLADTSHQVEARAISIAIVNAVLFIPLYFYTLLKGKKFFNKEYWKYAMLFCVPLIPHYLSSVILNQADRIMISHYIGDAEAAYYSVAYTLAGIMGFFNTAVAQSFDPWIYQSLKEKKLDRIGSISYRITVFIALINFLVVLIAPEILSILAPENYNAALYVIPPVTISVFFMFMYNLFATFQFFYKKTKWIAIGSCIGAVLNVILNAVFIPLFGFIAAGYTTLVCYVLFGVSHYYFMLKVSNEFLDGYRVYSAKIIFGIGILLVVLCGIAIALYQLPIARYAIILGMVCIVAIKKNTLIELFHNISLKK